MARRRGRSAGEGLRGGISGEQAGGEHAVEAADVAGELGEAEIDQAMQLADAVVEVLAQPVAMADQLAQGLGDLVVQMGGFGALLEGEAGEAVGVDGVGLGALEAAVLEAPGDERVEQRDLVPGGGQHGEQVLPVMAGGLHDDEDGRLAERLEQDVVAGAVLGDRHGLADRRALVVHAREHVALGCDVDAGEHAPSVRGQRPGASEPVLMLTLVQARTQAGKAWPQDTVRALSTGRGRQSHRRGQRLKRATATLSQQSMRNLSRGARR